VDPPSSGGNPPPAGEGLTAMAKAFTDCFAIPHTERVTRSASGAIEQVDPACRLADPEYLNNGYGWEQNFGYLLSDPGMDAAVFAPPVVIERFERARESDPKVVKHPFCNAQSCALLRLEARQTNGVSRWLFLTGAPKGNGWSIVGNARPYDMSVDSRISRQISVNAALDPGNTYSDRSRFESRLRLHFDPSGPNGERVRIARVTGPGLPPQGV